MNWIYTKDKLPEPYYNLFIAVNASKKFTTVGTYEDGEWFYADGDVIVDEVYAWMYSKYPDPPECLHDSEEELDDYDVLRLWHLMEDVPFNPESETLEEDFYIWPTGTSKEEIWRWFDERYSKGVYALIYERN